MNRAFPDTPQTVNFPHKSWQSRDVSQSSYLTDRRDISGLFAFRTALRSYTSGLAQFFALYIGYCSIRQYFKDIISQYLMFT